MPKIQMRACVTCGREFMLKPRGGRRVYCSDTCRAAAWRERRAFRGTGTANQQALEEMLAGYVIPQSMAALVQTARCLAVATDEQPYNPGLWARYQHALDRLSPLVATDEDAAIAALIAEINSHDPHKRPEGPA